MGVAVQRLPQPVRGQQLLLHGHDGHPAQPRRPAGTAGLDLSAGHRARLQVPVGTGTGPLRLWPARPFRHLAGPDAGTADHHAAVAGYAAHVTGAAPAAGRPRHRLSADRPAHQRTGHCRRRPVVPAARPRPARPGQCPADGLRHARLCSRRGRRADHGRTLGLAARHLEPDGPQHAHPCPGPRLPRARPRPACPSCAAHHPAAVAAPVALLAAARHQLALAAGGGHRQCRLLHGLWAGAWGRSAST